MTTLTMYGKILSVMDLEKQMLRIRASSGKLVFTNGCFDLLHVGHIEYLMAARSLGSKLIVGINDDASVTNLKGAFRPINKLEDRIQMLSALQCVDFVIPFSEPTPLELIKNIKPHILVKGGDYTIETIVGASFVAELGGEVKVLPFKAGYSSTKLIDKIKKL